MKRLNTYVGDVNLLEALVQLEDVSGVMLEEFVYLFLLPPLLLPQL